jgi:hypothetical protein
MCRTQSWIGWRAPVLALATIALAASAAGAAQMTSGLAYGTTGSIGTDGMLGMPAVRFHGVDHWTQGLGALFSLGEFEVSAPSDHQTTTYAGTPFTLTYNDQSDPGAPPLVAQGNLFGTVSGSGQPNLLATLDGQSFLLDPSESGLQYRTWDAIHTLVLNLPLNVNQAQTPVMGRFDVVPSPEPSSWVLFLAAAASVGLLRRTGASRQG